LQCSAAPSLPEREKEGEAKPPLALPMGENSEQNPERSVATIVDSSSSVDLKKIIFSSMYIAFSSESSYRLFVHE